jgi:hypothetical protein
VDLFPLKVESIPAQEAVLTGGDARYSTINDGATGVLAVEQG